MCFGVSLRLNYGPIVHSSTCEFLSVLPVVTFVYSEIKFELLMSASLCLRALYLPHGGCVMRETLITLNHSQ